MSISVPLPIISIPEQQDQGNFRVFSYNELKYATTNFHLSNKIGEGGFGSVYKVNTFFFRSIDWA